MIIYHAIMFGMLLLGTASFVFQASENERLLSNESVPVKSADPNLDLNNY